MYIKPVSKEQYDNQGVLIENNNNYKLIDPNNLPKDSNKLDKKHFATLLGMLNRSWGISPENPIKFDGDILYVKTTSLIPRKWVEPYEGQINTEYKIELKKRFVTREEYNNSNLRILNLPNIESDESLKQELQKRTKEELSSYDYIRTKNELFRGVRFQDNSKDFVVERMRENNGNIYIQTYSVFHSYLLQGSSNSI